MEKQPLWKRCKRWRNRLLLSIGKYTLPYVYLAYIRFVWWTSKVTDEMDVLREDLQQPPYKSVNVLWHQDVFCVAWAFHDFRPHTIASVGDAGEIIARILKLCHFSTVLRGGSSKGKKRQTPVLDDMVEHMKTSHGVCGITVDGSYGPAYRLKHGAVVIARECGCPIFTTRIWCKRRILLPTWDRTMIPLPFNHLLLTTRGPFYPPQDADKPEVLEQFRQSVEQRMLDTTYHSFLAIDKKAPQDLLKLFPPEWTPPATSALKENQE
jgi:lysophospholipid acyltransferase (LPLAT)-like uncharacterized protein